MSIQNLQNTRQEIQGLIRKARALSDKYEGSQKGLDYDKALEGLHIKLMEVEGKLAAYKAQADQAHDPLA